MWAQGDDRRRYFDDTNVSHFGNLISPARILIGLWSNEVDEL